MFARAFNRPQPAVDPTEYRDDADDGGAAAASEIRHHERRERVLILRCCRPAEFAAAVRYALDRHPGAEIVALSHRGHDATLRAAGVDRVIEFPGSRFSVLRTPPWHWRRLRAEAFDEIVIPQMTDHASAYDNLHNVASLLRSETVVILPGQAPPRVYARNRFLEDVYCDRYLRRSPVVDQCLFLPLLAFLALRSAWSWRFRKGIAPTTARRRLLHIIPSLGVGGAQRQLFEVVNATPPERFEIEVLVMCDFGEGFATQWLKRDDVRITYLESYPSLTLMTRDVFRHCRRGRCDMVHTWLWLANWVGSAGARLARVPFVATSVRSLSLKSKSIGFGAWWHRPADVLGSRLADVITVNGRALARNYAAWAWCSSRRIAVVHNGLEPSQFLADKTASARRLREAAGVPDDAVLIGTVGRLFPEKNQALFLRMLGRLRDTHPRAHGVIVGEGPLQQDLEAEAERLGLRDAVTFLGQHRDPVKLTAGFDLFVLPSLREGFPNALLEAVMLGVPAIASDVGGNPDVLGDPALLFDPASDLAATQALAAVLDDPAAARERADRARVRALGQFTAAHAVARWLAIYDGAGAGRS